MMLLLPGEHVVEKLKLKQNISISNHGNTRVRFVVAWFECPSSIMSLVETGMSKQIDGVNSQGRFSLIQQSVNGQGRFNDADNGFLFALALNYILYFILAITN